MGPLLSVFLFAAAAAAPLPAAEASANIEAMDGNTTPAPGAEEALDEAWPDPWSEDLGLEGVEMAAACGVGVCALGPHLVLSVLTLGLWSGALLPAAIGVLITFVNNTWTRWNGAVMWPVVGAVLLSAAWTTVTWVGWAFFGSWFLAASDPNFAILLFPPNSSLTAQSLLPAVNVTFIVSQALTPVVATMGALVAYNVTSQLAPENAPTRWVPEGLFEGDESTMDDRADETDDARDRAVVAKTNEPRPERRAAPQPQRF